MLSLKLPRLTFFVFPALVALFVSAASPFRALAEPVTAEGTHTGGGGDASEARVDEIRADILKWISEGGYLELRLPNGITHEHYRTSMSKLLTPHTVVVTFTSTQEEQIQSDPDFKVSIGGFQKTCRGFGGTKDQKLHILCNSDRFRALLGPEQYRLVHHEFAGLAGLEPNEGPSSNYAISNQLTSFLKSERTWKLSIKKNSSVHEADVLQRPFSGAYELTGVRIQGDSKGYCPDRIRVSTNSLSPSTFEIVVLNDRTNSPHITFSAQERTLSRSKVPMGCFNSGRQQCEEPELGWRDQKTQSRLEDGGKTAVNIVTTKETMDVMIASPYLTVWPKALSPTRTYAVTSWLKQLDAETLQFAVAAPSSGFSESCRYSKVQ